MSDPVIVPVFLFLAGTTQAVLRMATNGQLYFMRPDKPANWLSQTT